MKGVQLSKVPEPLAFNTSMIGPVLAAFGNQEQKERFLAKTANLDIWWCQGFSEPDAGSDLASLRTTAVRDGDDWVVNGQKTWTTLGQHADWIFCLVRTDPTAEKKQRGISLLVFPMDTPGVTLRPIELIDGSHEVNEVFFEDVRVPAENLIGEENRGWDYAKFLLGNERVGIARIGSSKRLLAQAKAYAQEVTVGGRPLAEEPRMADRIAELENELLALELTALRVVAHSTDGKPHPASSVLKLRGSELQQEITELVVDIAGPLSVSSFADGGAEQRRRVTATDPGFDEKTWSRLAEMGLVGLPFAEEHGGMGAGPIEVAVVAEEIGRVLAPEPFVEAVVLAGGLVAAAGTDAQRAEVLAGIAEGTTLAAAAHV